VLNALATIAIALECGAGIEAIRQGLAQFSGVGHGSKGHNSFIIQVLNDELIAALWEKLEITKVEKLPSLTPFAPWTTAKHATGPLMVKTQNKEVLNALTAETHPIVFDCINKAQEMGWTINNQLFPIAVWALRNKTQAFAEIWELTNAEAKATKLREAKSIINIAKRFLNLTFYHLYYFDFRGRKYPTTAYLHEQGSDLARGLIKRSCAPEPIGFEGFRWLMIVIASNWAGTSDRPDKAKTDKIPMEERFKWAKAHEETFLGYAENPRSNDGWMKADKPWQFLAACIELFSMRVWQAERGDFDNYDYPSCFEGYFDGSNNGSQHLAALTRDEVTAPHVNLVPLDLPGDLYKYVGDHVWERLVEVTSQ
jgi:DNA-directed RNA polymerase